VGAISPHLLRKRQAWRSMLRGYKGSEAGEAWRGHGSAVPLQRQDAAFGLGALKRRPYNAEKASGIKGMPELEKAKLKGAQVELGSR
jgi:hypothetical protein